MKRIIATLCAIGVPLVGIAQRNSERPTAPAVEPAPGEKGAARSPRLGGGGFGGGGLVPTTPPLSPITSGKVSRGDSIPPVIIRFSASDAKANAELEQDLYVMARVLSRMLERAAGEQVEWRMNIPMVLTGAGKSVRPMYIEGTGPLFMIKVNFPVMPPPKAAPAGATAHTSDSEWVEAERDVFGKDDVDYPADAAPSRSGFNEDRVELLKREVMTALKNATNIRGLKPEEFVNIAVFGQANSGRVKSAESESRVRTTLSFEPAAAKGTVLTLRVRKSDIDAFAGGKVDFDAFKASVATAAYAGSGAGLTSINSWLQDASKSWGQ